MHRTVRALLSAATAALCATTVLIGVSAGPAMAETYGSVPLKAWSYVDKAQPSTPNPDPSGDYLIGSSTEASGLKHTGRAFFTFDLTALKGQVLHRVTFYTTERTVNDCSQVAPIEVWRTKPVTSTTTWQHPPKELELLGERSYGSGIICPGAYLGIDMIPAIQAAFARGEKTLSVEVRVRAGSEGDARVGRTMSQARMSYAVNHAPRISGLKLKVPDAGCGTLERHPTAGQSNQVQASVTDADPNDHPWAVYAFWPVDRPDLRKETNGPSLDLNGIADGTVVAWTAQGRDYDDAGAWGKTCYFTVDTTAPVTRPIVSSTQYPSNDYPGTGGPGVPGTFVLDAGGDTEVVAFDWYDSDSGALGQRAFANHPGGKAKVTITPGRWGGKRLVVTPRDAAGNRGPDVEYRYQVRNSAPIASFTVNGVGVTSSIRLASRLAETTAFGYAVNGAPEKRLPAVDGKAQDDLVFTSVGTKTVVTRAYAGDTMIGSESTQVSVTDAPKVTSAEFEWNKDPVEGVAGSFTFAPRTTEVVSYLYTIGGGEERSVDAAADGTAVLPWTPERPGSFSITVSSVDESGHRSQPTSSSFTVIALRPDVNAWTHGVFVGDPIGVDVRSYLPDTTAIVYSFDGGEPQTVNGRFVSFEVVATHSGDSLLKVWAKRADGTLTPPAEEVVHLTSAPKVVPKGPFGPEAVMSRPVSFTFKAAQEGATTFRYTIGSSSDDAEQPQQTVPVGPDGTATVTYDVPDSSGDVLVKVFSVTVDGTESETNTFAVAARNPGFDVFNPWPEGVPAEIGVPGQFGFTAWDLGDVTAKYLWHVNDDPVQEVAYDPWAWETIASYTPERAGANTLYVQREFTDGSRSPLISVPFQVGPA